MKILRTQRLILSEFELGDAEFIIELVNDPDWLKNIGSRNVHDLASAHVYLGKIIQGYNDNGFGFYRVDEIATGKAVGMCGLVKRPELEHIDLGFAFLPQARGKKYAQESSLGVIEWARKKGIKRLLGILNPENTPSAKVLEKVGMSFIKKARVRPDDIELSIYGMDL